MTVADMAVVARRGAILVAGTFFTRTRSVSLLSQFCVASVTRVGSSKTLIRCR